MMRVDNFMKLNEEGVTAGMMAFSERDCRDDQVAELAYELLGFDAESTRMEEGLEIESLTH